MGLKLFYQPTLSWKLAGTTLETQANAHNIYFSVPSSNLFQGPLSSPFVTLEATSNPNSIQHLEYFIQS